MYNYSQQQTTMIISNFPANFYHAQTSNLRKGYKIPTNLNQVTHSSFVFSASLGVSINLKNTSMKRLGKIVYYFSTIDLNFYRFTSFITHYFLWVYRCNKPWVWTNQGARTVYKPRILTDQGDRNISTIS